MVQIRRTRWTAVAVAAVVGAAVLAGCGNDSGGGGGGGSKAEATSSASATATVGTVEDAYRAYQGAMGGCTTVEECQDVMTARLKAVHDMGVAMKAEDPVRYAQPIADAARAERIAVEYGTTNLGAVGNMMAVMQPVQAVITWYASNR